MEEKKIENIPQSWSRGVIDYYLHGRYAAVPTAVGYADGATAGYQSRAIPG